MFEAKSTDKASYAPSMVKSPLSLLFASLGVVLMTVIIYFLHLDGSFANVSMLYLLVVTISAIWLGRLPAVLAAILSFLAFNWFFVEPRYRLAVADSSEWLALCMFLLIATVTGQLTALLRVRAEEAQRNKLEANALADATWAIASELNRDQALSKVLHQLASVAQLETAAIIAMDEARQPEVIAHYSANIDPKATISTKSLEAAAEHARSIDWQSPSRNGDKVELAGLSISYLPIALEEQTLAVLYLQKANDQMMSNNQQQIIDSLVNHAALILQRDRLMRSEAKSQALIEADRLKTALLAMVSHDFRSPLTSIKASVSSLLQDTGPWEPETQRAFLEIVDQETDRLNRMVGNILDLSRLEAGAWHSRREMTPVAELVGAALDSFSNEDNNRIQVDFNPALPDIWVDSVQIVQVIINLLENALKYAPATTVELRSSFRDEAVVIEVLDRGIGLPRREEGRIFEPFYRAPELKEGAIPGIGIGLAVCRGLVEAHGGAITAENREGGGSVFCVALPLHDANRAEELTAK